MKESGNTMFSFNSKDAIWLAGIVLSFGVTWGMWSERLNAIQKQADAVAQMQQDIAVIKTQIVAIDDKMGWMEEFLIKNYKEFQNGYGKTFSVCTS